MENKDIQGFTGATKAIKNFAQAIGLDGGAVIDLTNDPDWLSVVKAAYFVECAVKQTLAIKIGLDVLHSLSQIEISKLKDCAKSIGLYTNSETTFIGEICRLRNDIVHNIGGMDFSFEATFQKPTRLKQFVDAVKEFAANPLTMGDHTFKNEDFLKDNPKWGIVFGIFNLFAIGWFLFETEKLKIENSALMMKIANQYIKFGEKISPWLAMAQKSDQ